MFIYNNTICFLICRELPSSTLFPYTTLFRSNVAYRTGKKIEWDYKNIRAKNTRDADPFIKRPEYRVFFARMFLDRKSTRLNSCHVAISYAVFCLNKKNFMSTHSVFPGYKLQI